jgi:hypothetical protein
MLRKFNEHKSEKESISVNEALKMLMKPLMLDVMRAFSFKRDPKIREELYKAIDAAIRPILISHGIIVEGKSINRYSPLAYAERVANKVMTLADAAKEADMPQTQLLILVRKFDKSFKMTYEANDHEVGMAQGQLNAIIDAAMDLQEKIGSEEKDIPGWIQDHISQSYNYIKQANDGYHELEEALKLAGGRYVISPIMNGGKISFGFIGDSKTVDSKSKEEIAADIEKSLRNMNRDLVNVFTYDPYSPAAGVVFKMDSYAMIEYLEKNMK